ncbi:olfactory receptor 12D2-like [Rhinatrema bivittatum]|uniref:olfactory receptor 12D2-like n=1 Tax=Rhinatrema bivittatum TaxID=194408 RepID=UPI001129C746|nr:olfactory receptor 12D2-like [Rhinatrema bivittatum]
MEVGNGSRITEFILLGFKDVPELQMFLFALFSVFFLITLGGNFTIVILVITDPHLHIPMYFLLANLSFLDICYSNVTVPKLLVNFLSEKTTISFQGCITQLHFFHFFGSTEAMILCAMSYDRYVAICNPLRYPILMNTKVCILLALSSWVIGFLYSMVHTILTSRLPFCKYNTISNFYCDVKPLLKLACINTQFNERLLNIVTGFIALSAFSLVMISYYHISSSILKMHSINGREKAISTCASHLTVVCFYYETAICTYLRPTSEYFLEQDRISAIFVTVFTPALNPIIYTLRNKEVQSSLRRTIITKTNFC